MTERIGDWLQTYSGQQFWPLDPRANEVSLHDIAHHLAMLCRFGGACRSFYSVAEHSVRVSLHAESVARAEQLHPRRVRLLAIAGLLHDAGEAYLVDVPRPIKSYLGGYREAETGVQNAVWEKFQIPADVAHDPIVHQADEDLLATEFRDLMWPNAQRSQLLGVALQACISPVSTIDAEDWFLDRYAHLHRVAF